MLDRGKVIEGMDKLRKELGYGLPDRSNVVMEYLNSLTDAIVMLKEQEQDVQNLIADLDDLQKEHEKLLDKKIPLITSGKEVIRCKDCKYANRLTPYSNVYECASPNAQDKMFFQFHASDWFCADGEKGDG